MSQTKPAPTQSSTAPKKKLQLFAVTVAWNPNDSSSGTYAANAWAYDHGLAVRKIATDMAFHSDSGFSGAACRKRFIENAVNDSNTHVGKVAPAIAADVHELLRGPRGNMNKTAQADFDTIIALLAKYDGGVIRVNNG